MPDLTVSATPTRSKQGPITLALIGAGKAGRSLAALAIKAGHHVLLEDVLPSRLREALEEIPTAGMLGTLELVMTVEDAVREADLVIDFVPDELESKLEIVCMVDRMAPPKTIMCINTHALSVTDLANCTYRMDRCIGAEMSGDIHLVSGAQTSIDTACIARRFFESCGWTVSASEEHVPAGQTL